MIERDEKGYFKKGCSGNPNGRPKNKNSLTQLLRAMGDEAGDDGVSNHDAVVARVYELARKGEPWAVQLVWDRLEGKAVQQVKQDVTTDGESLNARVSFKKAENITQMPAAE